MEAMKAALPIMLFLALVPLASAAGVTRSLSSTTVAPGGQLTVTLSVDVAGDNGYYAIDDVFP